MKILITLSFIFTFNLFLSCSPKNDDLPTPAAENKPIEIPQTIRVENNPKLNGISFPSDKGQLNKDAILLFKNGTITYEQNLKPKKQNTLIIEGSGSLLKNEPVIVEVIINDIKVDQVKFSKDNFEAKNIKFKTDKPSLTVQLNFINDYYNQDTKEDRNFSLKSISIK